MNDQGKEMKLEEIQEFVRSKQLDDGKIYEHTPLMISIPAEESRQSLHSAMIEASELEMEIRAMAALTDDEDLRRKFLKLAVDAEYIKNIIQPVFNRL